jgi:hypothetical protein
VLKSGGRFLVFGFAKEVSELEKIAHRTGFTVIELGTTTPEKIGRALFDLVRG